MAKVTKNVVEVPDPPYTVTIELSQEESATRHANYACCYFHRIKGGIMTETSDLRERVAGLAREWLWNREHNEAGMTTPGELADAILAAVSAAAPESPEDPCATCGKPRREHRSGYSAYRCTFRDAAAPDETRREAVRSVLIDAVSRESFSGTDIDALTDLTLATLRAYEAEDVVKRVLAALGITVADAPEAGEPAAYGDGELRAYEDHLARFGAQKWGTPAADDEGGWE